MEAPLAIKGGGEKNVNITTSSALKAIRRYGADYGLYGIGVCSHSSLSSLLLFGLLNGFDRDGMTSGHRRLLLGAPISIEALNRWSVNRMVHGSSDNDDKQQKMDGNLLGLTMRTSTMLIRAPWRRPTAIANGTHDPNKREKNTRNPINSYGLSPFWLAHTHAQCKRIPTKYAPKIYELHWTDAFWLVHQTTFKFSVANAKSRIRWAFDPGFSVSIA